MNKLGEFIQKKRDILEKHIDTVFEHKKKSAPAKLQTYIDSLHLLQNMTPRGKMLRGMLSLLAYEMLVKNPSDEIINAAAAIEIMETAILTQDDFMDQDMLRRGQPSIFAHYIEKGKNQQTRNPQLYGGSMAVAVGDIGYFLAVELMNKSSTDIKKINKALDFFVRDWQLLGGGQMMDVDISSRPYEPTEEEIMTIYTYKTARYSISQPLCIGAILAGADEGTIEKLDKLGESLGIIFQMKDDELGILGDEKNTGKPVGSDIRENKKTLLRLKLMQNVSPEEKKKLSMIFGNKNITEEEIQHVKNLIRFCGVLEDLQKKTDTLVTECIKTIDSLPVESSYISLLKEFVELIIKRNK